MTRPGFLAHSSAARSRIGQALRELPRPGPGQTPQQARARWFAEQAQRNLQLAEASWDAQPPEEPDDG